MKYHNNITWVNSRVASDTASVNCSSPMVVLTPAILRTMYMMARGSLSIESKISSMKASSKTDVFMGRASGPTCAQRKNSLVSLKKESRQAMVVSLN